MTAPLPTRLPPLVRHALRPLLDPYRRYRHAKLIHAARVALAVLVSIALSTGLNVPHGEWSTITVLIVVGGLQHHGNIRKKAAERALGTSIGALAGLGLILLYSFLHAPFAIYLLMAVGCGVCAYHAIGKAGYIALLSAITMVIVAGHGDNEIVDGLWRAVNVLAGIAIALAFSFALPLYATYSWRYKLADALRACAAVHARLAGDRQVTDDAHLKEMAALSTLLVQLRSLMPSVAKECETSMTQLEAIQRSLRLCIGYLEILSSALPADDVAAREYMRVEMKTLNRRIRDTLVGASRALKFGTPSRLAPRRRPVDPLHDAPPPQLSGYVSITAKLAGEVDQLRERLLDTARSWNI
ncbi:FUSC family protein [Burkholderia cenocepacia]|uniref:FUSC family protein n=1 Tax=Burkholderia cenocepacia TaxID=95486 RepID=UPI000F57FB80|nr:FUSC family protein [Burkholderia cenocepacia]RQU07962.1 FUSC family protein [Burkholderia cenocepacia]RQV32969.1 FUSC family protein [Burkholderia cenocepacia]RQV33087.1 FUSC family protein [Burkholderia cenocepacia]RQV69295.1 FUSC family protein [Burkholderia cenocepacia]